MNAKEYYIKKIKEDPTLEITQLMEEFAELKIKEQSEEKKVMDGMNAIEIQATIDMLKDTNES